MNFTAHTIKLQDGTLFNFKRRFKKQPQTLVQYLVNVRDGRCDQGKRHPLPLLLLILFGGITSGYTTINDCYLWAVHNRKWLESSIAFPHGIPTPTTIARAIQVCDIGSLITAWNRWRRIIFGWEVDDSASFDGKTIRGAHGAGVIRHILSLFTHKSNQTIGQVGVDQKENEIPAALRLFDQVPIAGLTLVGDALHAQTETAKAIIARHAYYFLLVKGNQKELAASTALAFADSTIKRDMAVDDQIGRGREITTTVEVISDPDIIAYLAPQWVGIACIGRAHRVGTRTYAGVVHIIDETVYFISSRENLTAMQATKLLRRHWRIENNLHWRKDYTFLEDRQTLRLGNAPQVMSFLRSMCIGLFSLFDFFSVTEAVTNFRMNTRLHHRFLALAAIV